MSRYGLDKALWTLIRGEGGVRAYEADPDKFVEDFDLTETEREAFTANDIRSLYEGGAIPFLVYQAALVRAGGFSFEFVGEYVAALQGATAADITT